MTDNAILNSVDMKERVPTYLQYDEETVSNFSFETCSSYHSEDSEKNNLPKRRSLSEKAIVVVKKSMGATSKASRSVCRNTKNVCKLTFAKTLYASKKTSIKAKRSTKKVFTCARNATQSAAAKAKIVSKEIVLRSHTVQTKSKEVSAKASVRIKNLSQVAIIKSKQMILSAYPVANLISVKVKENSKKSVDRMRIASRTVMLGTKEMSRRLLVYTHRTSKSMEAKYWHVSKRIFSNVQGVSKLALARWRISMYQMLIMTHTMQSTLVARQKRKNQNLQLTEGLPSKDSIVVNAVDPVH